MDHPSPELVRATLAQREEGARRCVARGKRPPGTADVPTARRCSWCGDWPEGEPDGPYVETSMMCDGCREEHFPESLR